MSLIWVYFLRSFLKSILSYDTNLYDKVFAMLDIILYIISMIELVNIIETLQLDWGIFLSPIYFLFENTYKSTFHFLSINSNAILFCKVSGSKCYLSNKEFHFLLTEKVKEKNC